MSKKTITVILRCGSSLSSEFTESKTTKELLEDLHTGIARDAIVMIGSIIFNTKDTTAIKITDE